jgi:circadian clock protein KaiB
MPTSTKMKASRKMKRKEGRIKPKGDGSEKPSDRYVLRLYVSGTTPRSANALTNIKRICEEKLKGRYDLEVIDIYRAKTDRNDDIIAVPTLIKKLPLPLRRLIGDLSDEEKVLVGLDLKRKDGI